MSHSRVTEADPNSFRAYRARLSRRVGTRIRKGRPAVEIRFPPYLFEQIKGEAQGSGRSFNAMVIHLLEAATADYEYEGGPMRIYIAGPMRGYPEFNFPAFHAAAAKLRADGHTVFNPAEQDMLRHGVDISKGNLHGDETEAARKHGFDLRVALGEDLAWICQHAEAIALLPGWHASDGASAEYAAAIALGLKVIEL